MATLLIEIEGVMQSWGYRGRFSYRETALEPTKSGVTGIIAACLGMKRDADLSELSNLIFGVRVDSEGTIKKEFQTALNVINTEGKNPQTQLTYRQYLANARFIAGVEGNLELLTKIKTAIQNPYFSPFLGRKSYINSVPFLNPNVDNLVSSNLVEALSNYPYLKIPDESKTSDIIKLRLVRDAIPDEENETQDYRQDVPVSFSNREFLTRKVITEWVDVKYSKQEDKNVSI